ncbi:hypothetical protein BD408DRAFT_416872 [Parasitella parasitica]|nr:hypothetical protein BD408DRAFT_416872 [Parasitella parasitica]
MASYMLLSRALSSYLQSKFFCREKPQLPKTILDHTPIILYSIKYLDNSTDFYIFFSIMPYYIHIFISA